MQELHVEQHDVFGFIHTVEGHAFVVSDEHALLPVAMEGGHSLWCSNSKAWLLRGGF